MKLYQKTPSGIAKLILHYLLLILLAFVMLFPFWFMFIGGFRTTAQINSVHFTLIPEYGFGYLENFQRLFLGSTFPRSVLNTVFIAGFKTIFGLFFASLAGFAFEKMSFPGRKILFYFVVATMMIPGTVTMIPLYVMMAKFGWVNTFLPLLIPGLVSAYGIFIMRQYMASVPNEIIYSAHIDGCGDMKTFLYIVLPVVQPGLVVLGIILFMQSWNDFLWPLVILSKEELYTVTITLNSFKGAYNSVDYGTVMGGAFFSALPMLILFLIFKERLLTGLVAGSVK